jgi:hypothetical protein
MSFRIFCTFRKHHTKKSLENSIDPFLPWQIEILLIDEKTEEYGYAWRQRNKVDDMKNFSYFLHYSALLYLPLNLFYQLNFAKRNLIHSTARIVLIYVKKDLRGLNQARKGWDEKFTMEQLNFSFNI